MPKISWQLQYDHKAPKTCHEEEQEKIRALKWDLDIFEGNYTLEELKEMKDEARRR